MINLKLSFGITVEIPTQGIIGNPRSGYIYKGNNHIAIDCGTAFHGKLVALAF